LAKEEMIVLVGTLLLHCTCHVVVLERLRLVCSFL